VNFDRKIIIVTPWVGEFAGGAEVQARGLAVELNRRGVETIVFTTCSRSPYYSWWDDYYDEGVYQVYGVQTHRFVTNKSRERYEYAVGKYARNEEMSEKEKEDFFICGINSDKLVESLANYLNDGYEVIALPYFQGLTHALLNGWPGRVSIIPCFHDEDQFYWNNTRILLNNAKHIFFNSIEEKELCIRAYGPVIGRKVVEGVVTGEGVDVPVLPEHPKMKDDLPESYFVYAGRKERGKNVHILCDWFLRYKKEFHTKTKLVFVGGGDNSLVPGKDDFVDYGFVSEEKKTNVMRNSRAVITLSEKESFSLVIMQAWLLARPVIVSGRCDVTKGHAVRANGGLYPENAAEFTFTLNFLERNPDVAEILGQSGRNYVKENFSYDAVLEKYLKVLVK